MLLKGNEIVTRTIKRLSEVNSIGIRLNCLKIRNMLAPSSQMSCRVIGHKKNLIYQVLRIIKDPILLQRFHRNKKFQTIIPTC